MHKFDFRWLSAGICLLSAAGCSAAAETAQESSPEGVEQTKSAVTESTYTYFTCNATGWQPTEANRLVSTGIDSSLDYTVTQPWMVTNQDNCVFVTTNALDGWGTQQTFMGAYVDGPAGTDHNHYVVASGASPHLFGTSQFNVTYPALGAYHVQIHGAKATFSITAAAAATDAPDTTITGQSSPFPYMALYTFTSTEPVGGTFECRCDVNGFPGTWKTCVSGDINTASCGSPAGWLINVRAINALGVADPTPATSH